MNLDIAQKAIIEFIEDNSNYQFVPYGRYNNLPEAQIGSTFTVILKSIGSSDIETDRIKNVTFSIDFALDLRNDNYLLQSNEVFDVVDKFPSYFPTHTQDYSTFGFMEVKEITDIDYIVTDTTMTQQQFLTLVLGV